MELILQVGVGQLTEQQKDTLVRQLAVLLDVLDSDIKVQRIQAHSDLRCELQAVQAKAARFLFVHVFIPFLCPTPLFFFFFLKGEQ